MTKKINISTPKYPNTYTLVDDEDYEYLNQWKWHCIGCGKSKYAARRNFFNDGSGKSKIDLMHRSIMKNAENLEIDHRNGDGLDNRRENLRAVTRSQNSQNRQVITGVSKFKGVYLDKRNNKWVARIKVNGKNISLGSFRLEEDAGLAYNKAAKKYFGEFACLNKVGGDHDK